MRKPLRAGIVLGVLAAFIGFSILGQGLSPDNPIMASLWCDILMGLCGTICYTTSVGDTYLQATKQVIILGLVFLIPVWIVTQVTGTFLTMQGWNYSLQAGTLEGSGWLYLIMAALVAPVTEEIVFRGCLFGNLKQMMSLPGAYLISSLVFGAVHGDVAHVYAGLLCGWFFCLAYEYSGRIMFPIICHCLFNIMTLRLGQMTLPEAWFKWPVVLGGNLVLIGALVALTALVYYTLDYRNGKKDIQDIIQ